jgi:hypothetical protein
MSLSAAPTAALLLIQLSAPERHRAQGTYIRSPSPSIVLLSPSLPLPFGGVSGCNHNQTCGCIVSLFTPTSSVFKAEDFERYRSGSSSGTSPRSETWSYAATASPGCLPTPKTWSPETAKGCGSSKSKTILLRSLLSKNRSSSTLPDSGFGSRSDDSTDLNDLHPSRTTRTRQEEGAWRRTLSLSFYPIQPSAWNRYSRKTA